MLWKPVSKVFVHFSVGVIVYNKLSVHIVAFVMSLIYRTPTTAKENKKWFVYSTCNAIVIIIIMQIAQPV